MKLKNLLERRNLEKFKDYREYSDSSSSSSGSKAKIFGSLALMLKVYANDGNRQESEKIVIVDSVNKAFETLKIIFTRKIETFSQDVACQPLQNTESSSKSISSDDSKCWYPSCISRYLQDCQRVTNEGPSLCKTMSKITSEPRMFVTCRKRESRVEYTQQDLVDIANVLMKLKKYLKQHCQRQRLIAAKASMKTSYVDKAVQCDYLQVSPEVRFFSRSSLVVEGDQQSHQQQQHHGRRNSSPSLEYVANYRPEFHGREKTLRSLSSSAIFGLSREKYNYSRSPRRNRLRATRGVPSLDTIRRTEDDMLRYSNFIEGDLTSFHYNPKFQAAESSQQLDRNDVLAVRKILLDDYITEVKEIIRSELSSSEQDEESQIMNSVRKRMDDDVILSERTESCNTLSPTTSYVTARECLSSCCFCENPCDFKDSGMCLKFCESKREVGSARGRFKNRTSYLNNKARYSEIRHEEKNNGSTSAKSSQSVDSGVQLDYPRSSTTTDWNSSDETSLNDFKSNIQTSNNDITSNKKSSSSSSETGSSDEMLCRRVESAVRKFTEKLIVCERRARDRSRSSRGGTAAGAKQNPRGCTSLTDNRTLFDYSSEDDRITGISTPSLVSTLSDEEIPT